MQASYSADAKDQVIRNPEAVPLFFSFLRQADDALQAWGLSAWLSLVSGNIPNLSACDRCGQPPLLIVHVEDVAAAQVVQRQKGPLESGKQQGAASECRMPERGRLSGNVQRPERLPLQVRPERNFD